MQRQRGWQLGSSQYFLVDRFKNKFLIFCIKRTNNEIMKADSYIEHLEQASFNMDVAKRK